MAHPDRIRDSPDSGVHANVSSAFSVDTGVMIPVHSDRTGYSAMMTDKTPLPCIPPFQDVPSAYRGRVGVLAHRTLITTGALPRAAGPAGLWIPNADCEQVRPNGCLIRRSRSTVERCRPACSRCAHGTGPCTWNSGTRTQDTRVAGSSSCAACPSLQ